MKVGESYVKVHFNPFRMDFHHDGEHPLDELHHFEKRASVSADGNG